MRRSCAPSVLSQLNREKRPVEEEVSRVSGRKRKKINFKEVDDDYSETSNSTDCGDIVRNYSTELKKSGIDTLVWENFDCEVRAAHEAFIKRTLGAVNKLWSY